MRKSFYPVLPQISSHKVYSRAIHSAGLALVGACGFLGSAVLPPDAYKVS